MAPFDIVMAVVFGLNIVFLPIEFWLLSRLISQLPSESQVDTPKTDAQPSLWQSFATWPAVYAKHSVFLASLAYCFLFITVLMPGGLMSAFLISRKIPDLVLAGFRGACAITGLLATLLASPVAEKLGIERAGMLFVWFQFSMLVPAVVFLIFFSGDWVVYVFLLLVVLSRVGLWGFDLVEIQLMQTRVEQSQAGLINSAEHSTYSLFSTLPLLAGLLLAEASFFVWLVVASSVSVLIAAVLFSIYAAKQRKREPNQIEALPTLPDEDAWMTQDDEQAL